MATECLPVRVGNYHYDDDYDRSGGGGEEEGTGIEHPAGGASRGPWLSDAPSLERVHGCHVHRGQQPLSIRREFRHPDKNKKEFLWVTQTAVFYLNVHSRLRSQGNHNMTHLINKYQLLKWGYQSKCQLFSIKIV